MIASIATAVLPVWRSPMISSRWPRPIGTMESMDFRPVCTGWSTDLRLMTPGATFSIGAVSLVAIGPLPSIGAPRGFTTRPSRASPTGTSRMPERVPGELEHFAVGGVRQTVNADDAVRHGNDRALVAGLSRRLELLDPLLDEIADLGCLDCHLSRFLSVLHGVGETIESAPQ
jgi:hypothetical protein